MSEATAKLARSRAAIVQQLAHPRRREDGPGAPAAGAHSGTGAGARPGGGLWGNLEQAMHAWWRHHPAHMVVDLATPMVRSYARRKPLQMLGIAFLAGAGVAVARPWRLISATTLVVALLKSSHLPGVLMAAMSAADFQRDAEGPE